MSDLVVIGYDNEFRADEVRLALVKMQKDYLLDLEDAVVAVKKADGKVKLHQATSLPTAGAMGGGFWGLLIGTIFLNPLLGAATGSFMATVLKYALPAFAFSSKRSVPASRAIHATAVLSGMRL